MGAPGRRPLRGRSGARRAAMQAIYQWQMTGLDPHEIEAQFETAETLKQLDVAYFHTLLHRIPGEVDALDARLAPVLDRTIAQLDPVERAILRIGVFELAFCPDVPVKVVLNEAIELAHAFGAEQSHKYINGILNAVSDAARASAAVPGRS